MNTDWDWLVWEAGGCLCMKSNQNRKIITWFILFFIARGICLEGGLCLWVMQSYSNVCFPSATEPHCGPQTGLWKPVRLMTRVLSVSLSSSENLFMRTNQISTKAVVHFYTQPPSRPLYSSNIIVLFYYRFSILSIHVLIMTKLTFILMSLFLPPFIYMLLYFFIIFDILFICTHKLIYSTVVSFNNISLIVILWFWTAIKLLLK